MDKQSLYSSWNTVFPKGSCGLVHWPQLSQEHRSYCSWPHYLVIFLTRVFVLCRLSHEKMRRCENALSTPHLSMWTNFLKTVSFLLENFCFQGAGLNAWSKDNHKQIKCKLAQHYPTASRIFSFLPVLLKQNLLKGSKNLSLTFYHSSTPRRNTFHLSPLLILQMLLHFYLWNPKL